MVKASKAKNLGNTADANIEGWAESIRRVKKKFPVESIDIIVPGHGDVGDYSSLETTENLLEKFAK